MSNPNTPTGAPYDALGTPPRPGLPKDPPLATSDVDGRIVAAIRNSFNFKTYLKSSAIRIQSVEGVVSLRGSVAQDYQRILALETAAGMPGVIRVENHLTLDLETGTEDADAWITLRAKAVLACHPHVSAVWTGIETAGGIVTLTGSAVSEAQKELTGEYVKDVEGVLEVRNELLVLDNPRSFGDSLGEQVDDMSITAQIKVILFLHKATHALATKVSTELGIVTLHGEAQNEAEKALVSKLAADVVGVKYVNNLMICAEG